jgi:fatty-acyl-CoA synthase
MAALPPGADGEIRVRGHLVMQGYYRDPAATAAAITPDGWFRTGDIGRFDGAGYLTITGRLKEMFIIGGTNAYPAEIERFLETHPAVRQAVVCGVPDRRLGEIGFAYVKLRPGSTATPAEIIGWCRGRIADYKVPRHVAFLDDFPLTTTNKIHRSQLQAEASKRVTSGGGR